MAVSVMVKLCSTKETEAHNADGSRWLVQYMQP